MIINSMLYRRDLNSISLSTTEANKVVETDGDVSFEFSYSDSTSSLGSSALYFLNGVSTPSLGEASLLPGTYSLELTGQLSRGFHIIEVRLTNTVPSTKSIFLRVLYGFDHLGSMVFSYSQSTNKYTLASYSGTHREVFIPPFIKSEGHGFDEVTAISEKTFYNVPSLEKVEIPSTMLAIGRQAFDMCENLFSVTLLGSTAPSIDSTTFEHNEFRRTFYVANRPEYVSELVWDGYSQDIVQIT
jgi:hypothetical protein